MRKGLVALVASVSLLIGGWNVAPASAAPSSPSATPPATAKHKAHVGVRAPKSPLPTKNQAKIFTPCGANTCYKYTSAGQVHAPADGASIDTTIEKPTLISGDFHSLFELAVVDSAPNNTLELGVTVDPLVNNGSRDPHLFTFMWDGGAPQCYNGCPAGGNPGRQFLDAANCSPFCAGDNLVSMLGTSHSFKIQHYTSGTAGWWILVDNVFRGVWPDTQFVTPSSKVDQTQAFGEASLANTPSETDIGNAVLSSSTTGSLAQNFALYNSTSAASLGTWAVTEPARWNLTMLSPTSFRYGGPGGNEDVDGCSGVGAQPTFGFGAAPYNGGFGTQCLFSNTSGGVPVTPVYNKDGSVTRNVCIPNLGTADGQTTTPIRVQVNTTYVKWFWFRDANCAGASMLTDYGRSVLPTGWTALAHASMMRSSTLNSH